MLKDEALYISEWLEFHLLVGVNKFWLTNNNSGDNISTVLAPYIAQGIVNLTFCPLLAPQLIVYNSWLPILRKWSYWVAVIDIDEFLVPLEGRSVVRIL
jgi:hypothetical protein